MQFTIEGTVTYTFTPNEETEEKIKEYAQEHKCTLAQALWALYFDGQVQPYGNADGEIAESDYCTETIEYDGSEAENTEFEDWG
jgi:hypothetical protein